MKKPNPLKADLDQIFKKGKRKKKAPAESVAPPGGWDWETQLKKDWGGNLTLKQAGEAIALLEELVAQARRARARAEEKFQNGRVAANKEKIKHDEKIHELHEQIGALNREKLNLEYSLDASRADRDALRKLLDKAGIIDNAQLRSVHKANEEISHYRMILGHVADFLRDLENRYLLECHECTKDTFRWKTVSIARDFLSLKGLCKPFARKEKDQMMVRPEFPEFPSNPANQ